MRILVIGGGWAGLAAAVDAVEGGAELSLWDMAPQLGGRARSWQEVDGHWLDSGQHILIGAYSETLTLMRKVGADPDTLLRREPLTLVDAQGHGLRWGDGGPLRAAASAVWCHPGWGWRERLGLARWALMLGGHGLDCPADWSVERLCRKLPASVRAELFEPLCVAALNTRIDSASGQVLLRVLRDALLGGAGAADLLLPRVPLQSLLPDPAAAWLRARGARLETGRRARRIEADGAGWRCDDWHGDAIIVATSSSEAVRLIEPLDAGWAQRAQALHSEAIATVEWLAPGLVLPAPMVALRGAPAQFLFDLGAMGALGSRQGHGAGRFVAVASAVAADLDGGLLPLAQRIESQVSEQVPALRGARRLREHADRRATFACTPELARPPAQLGGGLRVAGDYVDGPYPATLEGAVRSGRQAALAALGTMRNS